jgi:hypothetical protein
MHADKPENKFSLSTTCTTLDSNESFDIKDTLQFFSEIRETDDPWSDKKDIVTNKPILLLLILTNHIVKRRPSQPMEQFLQIVAHFLSCATGLEVGDKILTIGRLFDSRKNHLGTLQ